MDCHILADHKFAVQDVGCCLGQDIRQLMTDGWDQNELMAIDLTPDYW